MSAPMTLAGDKMLSLDTLPHKERVRGGANPAAYCVLVHRLAARTFRSF